MRTQIKEINNINEKAKAETIIKIANGDTENQFICLEGDNLSETAEILTLSSTSEKQEKVPSTESMTNLEVCKVRAPEESAITTKNVKLSEQIELPAKSLTVIVLK